MDGRLATRRELLAQTFRGIAVLAVGSLGACGGSESAAATTPSGPSISPSVPAANSAASGASASPKTVLASYDAVAADFAPLWVAYEAGIFRKVGVGVQLKSLTGLAGPAALIAGDIQIDVTGGPSVLGPIANGADVAVVGTFVPVYPYKLEVPPSIKRKEDLVGKKIGITSFGTASDVAARAALQKIGLAPDKDVSIVQVGSTAARLAALEKGEIQGTVGEPVDTVVLEAQGFHPLFDLAALNLPAAQGVIAARRSWLSANRGAMQAFMDAWVGATALMKKDRKLTTGVLTKYLKKGNRQAVEASYDYFVGHVFPLRPLPKAEQFADAIYWLGKRDRKIAALDAHKFIDASFVENVSSAAAR